MQIFEPRPPLLRAALSASLGLSLAACNLSDGNGVDDRAEADIIAQWQEENAPNVIECALDGAKTFARECLVERTERVWQTIFIVHHADGGFRRFDVMKEGEGLTLKTSDGADQAVIDVTAAQMRVSVAGDDYLFPADLTDLASE